MNEYDFRPDVVYTMGSRFAIHELTFLLAKYYKCGTCFHYMDNWRETSFLSIPGGQLLNRKLSVSVDRVTKLSKKSLVISPLMRTNYEQAYGGIYDVLMNSVEIGNQAVSIPHDKTFFVYAGGLHLNRHLSLYKIQESIRENKINATLIIYTSDRNREKYETIFDKEITEFRDFLPHNRVGEIYEEADVLVHVESFDTDQIAYTKYSLSTKIPEYMASGKPILCFAPKDISVYQYVEEAEAGMCASNEILLAGCMLTLSNDRLLREKLGKNGREYALANHDINRAQAHFAEVIMENVQ